MTGLTAAYVVETLRGRPPQTVFAAGARTCARMPGTGDAEPLPELAGSCPHRGTERGSTDPVADR